MRKVLLGLLLCVLLTGSALAAMSDSNFIELCKKGSLEQIVKALKNGANVNAKWYEDGSTPLMAAARWNPNPGVVAALIKAGANVNAKDEQTKSTPLMWAAQREDSNPEATIALIKAGANVNAKSIYGTTALVLATYSEYSNPEAMAALIKAGADINAKVSNGTTPLMFATLDSNLEAMTTLIEAGADVNAGDGDGRTPLMYAASNSNSEMKPEMIEEAIKTLLKHGADPKVTDNNGKTALDYSRENENLKNTDVTKKLSASVASAQDVVRVVVTGNNVNVRSAPSSKGKVYGQVDSDTAFLVDPALIRDKSDKSEWYKILFSVSEMDGSIYQAHKLQTYNFSYPYISAKFVKQKPLNEDDIRELDDWKQGRPVRIHVGEDLSPYSLATESRTLTKPLTLRKEPEVNADTVVLPAGTVILFCIDELGVHRDMDEKTWVYIMDKSQKLVGWETSESLTPVFDAQ